MESNNQMAGATAATTIDSHGETVQVETGYDKQEPQVALIAAFGVAAILFLFVVVLGIQAYFDHVKEQQVYEQVGVPVSDDFKQLRTSEDEALNSYKYEDNAKSVVRIPIKRAMELLVQEAAAGKVQYFSKEYPVKVANAPTGSPSDGTAGSTPNASSTPAPKP